MILVLDFLWLELDDEFFFYYCIIVLIPVFDLGLEVVFCLAPCICITILE